MCFAATDPSGGAGLQADLLTISSMGCHPLSVVTAITVQDTSGVDDVLPIDPEWGVDQARARAAKFFNCESEEIVFTSGATESNNLAILGTARANKKKGNQ